jgi:hypothetical protein
MNQALYAHMNNKRKMKKKFFSLCEACQLHTQSLPFTLLLEKNKNKNKGKMSMLLPSPP